MESPPAGAMTITWSLPPVSGGTEATVICENAPDHDAGLRSTLANLAAFAERPPAP